MRTNTNAVVTISNVFGQSQDRAVSSCNDSCATAAQHLASWHASHSALGSDRALKRREDRTNGMGMAGAVPKVKRTRLAVTGPQWQPVRLTSPELVTA
jgi:hypothetical protein